MNKVLQSKIDHETQKIVNDIGFVAPELQDEWLTQKIQTLAGNIVAWKDGSSINTPDKFDSFKVSEGMRIQLTTAGETKTFLAGEVVECPESDWWLDFHTEENAKEPLTKKQAEQVYRSAWLQHNISKDDKVQVKLEQLMDSMQPLIAPGPGPSWTEFAETLPGYLEMWEKCSAKTKETPSGAT